ncbi:biliverdin-producing heme oxygenase [Methylobacterium currus]|uniref:Biliverdin-producing heme oxygenase n=1 Tax=Methylobacterium currus TaxID=2051553 RepID=A0A2R4WQY3_9HYPH|nr:biliverdin-producing heme oxygenase [Methylobacterium currus]AWB23947.1 biliverdin-producing heme oxygenase [Methylobacterium currus]UHC16394.1 biliverdin-producing heme oxygenase [Methylobacterium currus]
MSDILERLRAETRAAHDAIERDLAWETRVATRDGYRALLARFWGFHAALEPALGGKLDEPAFFDPRRRLAHLAADLRFLGLDDAAIQALPRPRLAPPRDRDEAFGALYVLEGSTLGGQVIARHIGRQLGFTPEGGCRYYAAHGRETGAMWKAFRLRLAEEAARGKPETIAASATATFDAMRHWLCAMPVPILEGEGTGPVAKVSQRD